MKSLFVIVASVFALNAFAADAPKVANKAPAPATAPEAKKEHKKADATKSAPAKKDAPKANTETAKPATPAAK